MKCVNENQKNILEFMKEKAKKLSFRDLKNHLNIKGEKEIASFYDDINDLRFQGKIFVKDDMYQLFPSDLGMYQGTITINDSGRGYAKIDKDKFFIPREKLNGALDNDIVVLQMLHKEDGHNIAEVVQVVKRNSDTLVCEVNDNGEIVPIRSKYSIEMNIPKNNKLVAGDRITVILGEEKNGKYDAKIDKLIGHKDDLNIELNTIAYEFGFDNDLPQDVQKQLETIPSEVKEEDTIGRVDHTNDRIFTIDGADTKDIDDAISIDTNEKGNYILRVHIADVSHYVKPKTPLHRLALNRGTSLYLVNGVLPMLPHQLSNGICSLNEKVPRLAKTCEMEVDKNTGEVINFNIYKSVINSNKKMTYDDVNSIVEDVIVPSGYEKFVDDLELLKQFSLLCSRVKRERKALHFETPELYIQMEGDKPTGFAEKHRRTAEVMVENAMLGANETVATMLYYMNVPALYRIHEIPDAHKFNKALLDLKSLYIFKKYANLMTLNDINKLLDKAKGSKDYEFISTIILRQLKRARYAAYNDSHYGLGLRFYTHFTSPIRRLPDLIIHGLLDRYLVDFNFDDLDDLEKDLADVAAHSSKQERKADMAETAAEQMEMAKYLEDNFDLLKDEDIEAKIDYLDSYYRTVKLDNGITGKLDTSNLTYNKHNRSLIGKDHGEKVNYYIGDKVKVRLENASAKDRMIEFKIEGPLTEPLEPNPLLESLDKKNTKKLKR